MSQEHRIYKMSFASIYPLYIQKAERKGRLKTEVNQIIQWLTGYNEKELDEQLKQEVDFETFIKEAPQLNPYRISCIVGSFMSSTLTPHTIP